MRLTRRSLLMGAGAACLVPTLTAAARAAGAKRLVVVLADGGWDTTFVFDPKLDVPDIDGPEVDEVGSNPDDRNVVQNFGGLDVCVNEGRRRNVTTFFDKWGSRSTIVNGLLVGSIVHDFSRYRILTGTRLNTNPDLATITGHVLGTEVPVGSIDPSGLSLPGPYGASAGRLGNRNQLGYLLEPSLLPQPPPVFGDMAYPQYQPDDDESALRESFLEQRTGKAQTLRQLTDLTVGLLANDVCRAVTIDSGFIWDTHTGNIGQHSNFNGLFDPLDALVQGLDDRGLLDDTIVAVLSEMSRTPRLNREKGKDHWPTTSALLLGGPVTGGRVLGATDDAFEARPVDFGTGEVTDAGQVLRYDNFAAGMLAMLDIDPGDWFPGVEPYLAPMA